MAALAMLVAFNASARFGIIGGITTSSTDPSQWNLNTQEGEQAFQAAITGAHLGLAFEIKLPAGFGLQPAVLYSAPVIMKDGKPTIVTNDDYYKSSIEVPVQVQWGPNFLASEGKRLRPYVFAQPKVCYTLKTEEKTLTYGVALGAGIELGPLQISASYGQQFGPKDNIGEAFKGLWEHKEKNALCISIGLIF